MPPLSPLVHTEYVDHFVGLSKQEGASQDAAEEVSDALVKGRVPAHRVTCSPAHSAGDFDPERPVVGVLRRGLLATPHCHAPCRISGLCERGRN